MRNYRRLNLPYSGMIASVGRKGNSSQQADPFLTLSPMHISSYELKKQTKYSIKILNNSRDPISTVVSRMHPEEDLNNSSFANIKNSPLSSITNLSLNNALFVINKVLEECMNFHHHYGYSDFDLNLCSFSQQGELTIKMIKDLPYKETDQTITVEKIIKQVQTICAPKILNDFISYFNRNKLKTKCNYKCTKSLIKAYCICSKIQLQKKFNFQQKLNSYLLKSSSYKSVERTTQIQSSEGKVRKMRRMVNENYDYENKEQIISKANYKFNSFKEKTLEKNFQQKQLYHLFNSKLCKSSLLEPQNSLKVPSVEQSKGKGSQTSTNLKSSENHSSSKENYSDFDYPEETLNLPEKKHTSSSQFYVSTIHRPLLQTSLSQVQSHYESCSDHNLSPDGKNQQHNQIPHHDWAQKIDIFAVSKETIESFSEGKDEIIDKIGSNPQNLGKMARVICQSCLLAPPLESKVKEEQ